MKSLIQKLVETPGPPGYETEVRKLVRSEVEPYADEVHVDGLGNLIARIGPVDGRRILVAAHLDEPGLIASHVDRNGFVRFMPLGGLQPQVCAGQRVRFLNGAAGVIGFAAPGEAEQLNHLDRLFIDLGASECETAPVRPGDVAVFEGPYLDLGGRLAGKALSGRVGVAVLIETMRRLRAGPQMTPHEVHFAFVTQEQVGLRGAGAAVFQVSPELALSIDAAVGDTPGGGRPAIRLGAGPVIRVRDQSMLSDPRMVAWIENTATAAAIPFQMEVSDAAPTGARMAQLGGEGAATGVLSVACRYRGSPSELVDWGDVERLADLLHTLLLAEAPI